MIFVGPIDECLRKGERDQEDECLVEYDELQDLWTELDITKRYVSPENWGPYEAAMRGAGLQPSL